MSKKQHNLLFIFVISLLIASMPISVSAIDINCYKITTALTPILTQSSYTIPSSISISSPSTVQASQLSIVIDWPSNGQVVTAPTIVVSGTASSNVALNKVEVKVGSGTWQLASGTTSWSTTVNLASGTNTIYARVTDTFGNFRESSVIVTYSTTSYSLSSGTSSGILYSISSGTSSGKTYYVAKNGNDANPGTETQPWLTIQKAANTLVAGETVYVKAGTYYERVNVGKSGSAGNYITFAAYPGQRPIIDGSFPGNGALFSITNKQYIKISGFTLRNNVNGGFDYGIGVYGTSTTIASHHITIENNEIDHIGGSGIHIDYGTFRTAYVEGDEDYVIQNNDLSYTNIYVENYQGAPVAWQEALDLNKLNNFVIRNNIIRITYKEGISFEASRFGRIYGNTIYGGSIPYNGVGANGAGIYVGGSSSFQDMSNSNIEVYNNLIHGRLLGVLVASESGQAIGGVKVYNNIVYSNTIGFRLASYFGSGIKQNVFFHNNICYGNSNNGLLVDNQPMTNIVIRNNICTNNGGGQISIPGSGVTSDHNIVSGDPMFVDAANKDFHLRSGSPAIDTGSSVGAPAFDFDGNSRPRGAGYDIGAFEY